MRTVAGVLMSILMSGVVAGAARADSAIPQPFTATYAVTYRGIGAGTITFEFAREPSGNYVYETRPSPSGLARIFVSRAALERSVMQIDAQGVRPLEWRLDGAKSGNRDDGALRFDWAQGTVTGEIEGEPINLGIEPGLQDRSSIQIAVTTMLMRGQEPGTIPLIDDNRVKRYTYSKKESAVVESKLGKLDAVIYESTREGSSRVSRFWMVPSLEFIPARAEQIRKGKVETVMVLTELQRGE
jgi:Protein of unknown function (DUF3108)